MIKKNAVLLLIIYFSSQLVKGSSEYMSDNARGPKVKIHCAALLLKSAQEAKQDLPNLQPKKYDPVGRLWKRNDFNSLSRKLPTFRGVFEFAHAHPDASYGDVRSSAVIKQPLQYSKENILQCKLWALQAENLVVDNCTPEEFAQVLIKVDAWWRSELKD